MRLNVKLKEVLLLRLRATFDTLLLFYLRAQILRTYARKNYATVEINPNVYARPTITYFVSILFPRLKFTCVRTEKIRDSGNPA